MSGLARVWERIPRPGQTMLVVGDVMLDRYTWGDADRVSPEAPVVVLRADHREVRLGGAASVACLLRALEADVCLAGVVGDDAEGRIVRRLLEEAGIDQSLVLTDAERPTTTKERFIGRAAGRHPHQILRVDQETCEPLPEPVARELFENIAERCGEFSALLISDYAKGVCTPDLLSELIAAARRVGCPSLIDPARITDYRRYAGCDVLIPNRAETESVIASSVGSVIEAISAAKQLRSQSRQRLGTIRDNNPISGEIGYEGMNHPGSAVIVKLDRDGMVLVDGENSGDHYPTRAREVVDVTGAGDMVLAIVGLCRTAGVSLSDAVRLANLAAGLEVERIGVAPVTRAEILAECLRERHSGIDKIVNLATMAALAETYRQAGRRVVFTNDCFDLLHVGHVTCLQEAARFGDVLIVAINSDASVRKIKGSQPPIIGEVDRARLLAALACVSHVLIFDDDAPHELLRRIRPDVLVKGGTTPHVVGREVVESYGGRVCVTGAIPGVSTTLIQSRLTTQVDSASSLSELASEASHVA